MITPTSIKPVAIFTTIDDVVRGVLVGKYDDAGIDEERAEHFALRGWKEEFMPDIYRGTREVMLDVAPSTRTVVLPQDYIDYVRIGVVDTQKYIHNLSVNDLISNTLVDGLNPNQCTCECGSSAQEITEPVNVTTKHELRDFTITIKQNCDGCTYELLFDDAPVFPMQNVFYYKNAEYTQAGNLSNKAALDAYMTGIGFEILGDFDYSLTGCDNYFGFTYTDGNSVEQHITFERFNCGADISVPFTFTIDSYIKNGESISSGADIVHQSDLDSFFAGIGFSKLNDTTYDILQTADTYGALYFHTTDEDNVSSVSFIASNLNISYTYAVETQTRIVNVCNMPQDQCTCNTSVVQNSCAPPFGCYPYYWWCADWLCDGELLPRPSNRYGEFTIIREAGILQLNRHFNTTLYPKIYLKYYSDGLVRNGQYYVHIYSKPALIQYTHWQLIAHKRKNVSRSDKEAERQLWIGERSRAMRRMGRSAIQDLYDSIRTLPVI